MSESYDASCTFCRVVAGELDAPIVHEDDDTIGLGEGGPQIVERHARHQSNFRDSTGLTGPESAQRVGGVRESQVGAIGRPR